MKLEIIKTGSEEIRDLRVLFLQENNLQFIYNKCHDYGWADSYLFLIDDIRVGYGAVWGQSKREDRDAIFEFYIIGPCRKFSDLIFTKLCYVSGTTFIECQSNDFLLSSMLYEYSQNIHAEAILFEDHFQTRFNLPEAVIFQKTTMAKITGADSGEFVLERNDQVVATGGFMLNYNMPYADIYMEVKENFRQQGFGALIIQELKKVIYQMGRVPAARCNIKNQVSKATLIKAGFRVCGFILKGEIIKVTNK